MDKPHTYEIRVEGQLASCWSDWFDGMEICSDSPGESVLKGALPDQAALYGVLTRIHDLNLALISVTRLPCPDH